MYFLFFAILVYIKAGVTSPPTFEFTNEEFDYRFFLAPELPIISQFPVPSHTSSQFQFSDPTNTSHYLCSIAKPMVELAPGDLMLALHESMGHDPLPVFSTYEVENVLRSPLTLPPTPVRLGVLPEKQAPASANYEALFAKAASVARPLLLANGTIVGQPLPSPKTTLSALDIVQKAFSGDRCVPDVVCDGASV